MKGYPKSQFEVVNETAINEISTSVTNGLIPVMMQTYTSDKGSEDWELLRGLKEFTDKKGGLSFSKHGQSQLLIADLLRNGSYVLAKRLVSDDANLANATVKAKVVSEDGVSYLYLYATCSESAKDFKTACDEGYGDFDAAAEDAVDESKTSTSDIPLFTVAALGRGVSEAFIRLVPEYYISKQSNFLKYTFEVCENSEALEGIVCALNPDTISDGVNQSIQNKITTNSQQVQVKVYEDGFYKLVSTLAKTATISDTQIPISDLINMDFINGYDKKGSTLIDGIVTITNTEHSDEWTAHKPESIEKFYALSDEVGIPLAGGSNGTLGTNPMKNPTEYEKLLLGAWGATKESTQFNSMIYDLDSYKIDAVFDCNFPTDVKNAIINVIDFRGDAVFFADLGTKTKDIDAIIDSAKELTKSKYVAIYHNFFDVIDPYTKKQITVTMPYLLANRLISHISSGIGKPFAGIANSLSFPEIIESSINFTPVVIPGEDQKQTLVDNNVNYISYYDGVAVMETMYTNDDTYSQLSFVHNVMAIQEIIKVIRSRCPKTRYTFLDGDDLEKYIDDANTVINEYKTNFKSITMTYMADEKYEANNIFYAVIKVQFKNFVQEEYFKVIAIN